METKHEPLLLSVFLSNHLSGNSPLTESSVSKNIKVGLWLTTFVIEHRALPSNILDQF